MLPDLDKFLAEINANAERVAAANAVTEEQVRQRAADMAKRGYIMSAQSYRLLQKYMAGEGLYIYGDVGVGKTFFFRVLNVPILSLVKAMTKSLDEIVMALNKHRNMPIMVDDIGAEPVYNHFGTKMELLNTVLDIRLDSSAPTHFTSNVTPDDVIGRYGIRAFDRITGFAARYKWNGESHRKPGMYRADDTWLDDFFRHPIWRDCKSRCEYWDLNENKCMKKVEKCPASCERCYYFNH